jgi:acetylornithine/succinyldiaminopimelate/putrescine aminotransferase/predicted amino acid dehydrogenase
MPRPSIETYINWLSAYNPTRTYLIEQFGLKRNFVRGSGHHLFDDRGQRYLDFLAQYGAVSLGHNHPELCDALRECLDEQLPSMVQPFVPVAALELAQRLADITPGDLAHTIFANSGAEAVEAALKLSRANTGRMRILATKNGFHGKTLGALSATANASYQKPFGAPVPDFAYIPFGDLDALETDLKQNAARTAALIIEPIQGEGGVRLPPRGYLASAKAMCRRHDILLILDEIQTGLGRTGSMFAMDAEDVVPDILLLGKTLGGGMLPMSAMVVTRDAWDHEFGYLHSSTFANNNLGCRVGLRVIDILRRDDGLLIRHVAEQGRYLLEQLRSLQTRYPGIIKDVRGRGYLAALEFHPFIGDDSYTMAYLSQNDYLIPVLCSYLLNAHRIITAPVFNCSHILRMEPAFTAGRGEIDEMIHALDAMCDLMEAKDYFKIVGCLVGVDGSDGGRRRYASVQPQNAMSLPTDGREGRCSLAFLGHPVSEDDFKTSDPSFEQFEPDEFERWKTWVQDAEPGIVYHVPELRFPSGKRVEIWIIALPILPERLARMGRRKVMPLLSDTVELAREKGASIIGLGGFTSIVSKGGTALAESGLAVTTGSCLTSIVAVEGIIDVARRLGVELSKSHVAIAGATGSVGRLVARLLAPHVSGLTLVGNPSSFTAMNRCQDVAACVYADLLGGPHEGAVIAVPESGARGGILRRRLESMLAGRMPMGGLKEACAAYEAAPDQKAAQQLVEAVESRFRESGSDAPIRRSTSANDLRQADIVVAATSAFREMIGCEHLKSGAIVCDVGRPRNVARSVADLREDVLLFDGGLVSLPEACHFGAGFDLPPGIVFGCLAECIALALEGDLANHSLGQDLSLAEAFYIRGLAAKHGLRPAPPLCFDRPISEEDFERVRSRRDCSVSTRTDP